jgi:hypothetical protein
MSEYWGIELYSLGYFDQPSHPHVEVAQGETLEEMLQEVFCFMEIGGLTACIPLEENPPLSLEEYARRLTRTIEVEKHPDLPAWFNVDSQYLTTVRHGRVLVRPMKIYRMHQLGADADID